MYIYIYIYSFDVCALYIYIEYLHLYLNTKNLIYKSTILYYMYCTMMWMGNSICSLHFLAICGGYDAAQLTPLFTGTS